MDKEKKKALEMKILDELEEVKARIGECPEKAAEAILLEIMKDIKIIKLNTTK